MSPFSREWTSLPYVGISRSTFNGCYTVWFTTLKRSPTSGKAMPWHKDNRKYGDISPANALLAIVEALIFVPKA
jgi:hypothetical protein